MMYINKEDLFKDIDMLFSISLDNISQELKNDPDVIVALIKKDQRLVNAFSNKLRNDIKLMERVFNEIDSTLYHRLSPELKNDREFMLKLASVDQNAQYNLSDELKKDENFSKLIQKVSLIENQEEKGEIVSSEMEKTLRDKLSNMRTTAEKIRYFKENPTAIANYEELDNDIYAMKRLVEFENFDNSLMKHASKEAQLNFISLDPNSAKEIGIVDNEVEKSISNNAIKDMVGEELFNEAFGYKVTMAYMRRISLDKNGKLFSKCISKLNENGDLNRAEKLSGLNKLLRSFASQEYKEFLKNIDIDNINIDKLNNILSQPNYFNIKDQNDFENFDKIKQNVCDSIVSGNTEIIENYPEIQEIDKKDLIKFATLQKLFAFDLEDAQKISEKFFCIDEIKAEDKEELKKYVQTIIAIYKETDENKIKEIYEMEPVNEITKNKEVFNQKVKEMYAKEYDNTLFNANKADIIDSEDMQQYFDSNATLNSVKFVDAGTNFNMIVHSLFAFSGLGTRTQENFAESWNRDITNSKELSCSYIGSDMLGTAGIKTLCYGFDKMGKNSLEMSSDGDLQTNENNNEELNMINKKNKNNRFFPPQIMKDNTSEYNEMLFSRVQEGERKQPSYIVLFKKENKIDKNIANNALQAVADFKKMGYELPIVVVDVDRCIESEKNKINSMIDSAIENSDMELLGKADQKIHNNVVANRNSFSESRSRFSEAWSVINSKLIEIKEKVQVGIETYKNAYQKTNVEERKNEVSNIAQIYSRMFKSSQEKGNEYGR